MIRVGLYDDQELIRDGLRAILESADDVSVVTTGADGQALVDAVRARVAMDVVLVDIRMPGMDGLEATRRVTVLPDAPKVVVLTTFDEDEYVVAALRAGAVGFLLKRCTRGDLLAGVRAAAAGDAVLSPGVTRTVIARMIAGLPEPVRDEIALPSLTDRETHVLRGIGTGLTNAEIAVRLHLSESTVKTYVSTVLAKTSSRDRVQAALLAVRVGLPSLDEGWTPIA
ncbi:MAG TPA: response regulator transcription factor [Actinomycetales bacterium]